MKSGGNQINKPYSIKCDSTALDNLHSIIDWQKKIIEKLTRENIELTKQNAELYRDINTLKAEIQELYKDLNA